MTERAPGYYWIRFHDDCEWTPAYWDGGDWGVAFDERPYDDGDFEEIGEPCRREDGQEVVRLLRDYRLFEELSPPDVPRAEFVGWCFEAWEKQQQRRHKDDDYGKWEGGI